MNPEPDEKPQPHTMRTITRPPQSYPRRTPELYNFRYADEKLARLFLRGQCEECQSTPAEGIYEFCDVYVCGGKYVLLQDGAPLDFTFMDAENKSELIATMSQCIGGGKVKPLADHPQYRDTKANVVICKRGADNYGHFLVEVLPKLLILFDAGVRECTLWLADESKPFVELVQNLSRVLRLRIEVAFVGSESVYRFPSLVLPSPVSQHDSRKSYTLLQTRDLLKHAYDIRPVASKNSVFVCRSGAVRRKIVNFEGVRKVLDRARVAVIDPGAMSFKQQIQTFSSANVVIGGLGAGMTNMLFCGKESRMVLITPGLGDNFFWDLCCLCGHKYTSIFAKPLDAHTVERSFADYDVPLNSLEECLRNLCLFA